MVITRCRNIGMRYSSKFIWFNNLLKIKLALIGLIASLGGTASANTAPAADTAQSFNFSVYLDKRKIGSHRVNIDQQADLQQVHTVANFKVRLMLIPVYSYQHETRETWRNDCLTSVTSSTDDNGKDYFIESKLIESLAEPANIQLTTQDGEASIDGCIRTFAYWDIDMLRSKNLLNTQTGEYEPAEITDLGLQPLKIAGTEIQAQQYRLTLTTHGKTIDLWYTADEDWLALESVTESGAVLRYLPENPADYGIVSERS